MREIWEDNVKKHDIVIILDGGIVQSVEGLPEGYRLMVRDYDIQEEADDTKRELGYAHLPVVEANDPKVAEEYLPIIHLVFSNLKSWLRGTHHGVSPQHLQAYLNEFAFRFNRRFYPFNAFRSLLGIGANGESPTYDGLYSGKWHHQKVSHDE
jgi:ISXO2 transposase-like protein